MGQNYAEVAERLHTYRQFLCSTQEKMGVKMGVTQSHYAKLESGAKVISYDCLITFDMNGGDVHYLITGERLECGFLDEYMAVCDSEWKKLYMFRLIMWAVELGLKTNNGETHDLPGNILRNLLLAQRAAEQPGNIWKHIRQLNGLTQMRMAEILGINIKRYLRLENESIRPDAEILYRLYKGLDYTPMLILKPSCYYLGECNLVWERFSVKLKEKLNEILAKAAALICESKEEIAEKSYENIRYY